MLRGCGDAAGLNGTKSISQQPYDVEAYQFTDLWREDGGAAPFWSVPALNAIMQPLALHRWCCNTQRKRQAASRKQPLRKEPVRVIVADMVMPLALLETARARHRLTMISGRTWRPSRKQKGHMVLTPRQKLARHKRYDVHFQLQNADVGQDVRRCFIHLSKILQELEFDVRVDNFLLEPLDNAPGNLGPLLVFDFLPGRRRSFITQATPSASAANTITVSLKRRAPSSARLTASLASARLYACMRGCTHRPSSARLLELAAPPAAACGCGLRLSAGQRECRHTLRACRWNWGGAALPCRCNLAAGASTAAYSRANEAIARSSRSRCRRVQHST